MTIKLIDRKKIGASRSLDRQISGKKSRFASRLAASGGAAILAAALVACGGAGTPSPVASPPVEPSASTSEPEPSATPTAQAIWPLTGLPGEVVERPAVSVKVENTRAAYPLVNLERADIVWEEMVEGGITRFFATYHSQLPDLSGPARSVRPMDAPIGAPLGGLLAFSGGQQMFITRVASSGQRVFTEDDAGPAAVRSRERRMPHNLFFNLPKLIEVAQKGGAVLPAAPERQWNYASGGEQPTAAAVGNGVGSIDITFPAHRLNWSWAGTTWARTDAGSPTVAASGERLTGTNIVVLRVNVKNSGAFDSAGNPVPETVLNGQGQAWVATGGKILEGTWHKTTDSAPIDLRTVEGNPIKLAPGTTWVELVPKQGGNIATS